MNFEYMGLAEGVTKIDILEWWVKNEEKLYTKLGATYKKIVLCQPSSAATERIFSFLKNSLTLTRILPSVTM